jgi:hypothetical protein
MILDGIIFKVEDILYLAFLNPITDELTEAIALDNYEVVSSKLEHNEVIVVTVVLKDGTKELNDVDVINFLNSDVNGLENDIYYTINNKTVYSLRVTVEEFCNDGHYDELKELIKKENEKENK